MTTDGSAAMPEAMAETAESLRAETGVAGDVPESRTVRPVAPKEQTVPPKASQGMVLPAVQPQSPPLVPRATAEEDKVEEIERAEP